MEHLAPDAVDPLELVCRSCGEAFAGIVVAGVALALPYCPRCANDLREAEDVAEREQALRRALDRAGATTRLRPLTLASHPTVEARQVAERWLADYRAGARRNLWLSGPVGTMKTGLAWGIVREIVAEAVDQHYASALDSRAPHPRVPALLVVWRDLYDALLTSFRSYRDSGFVADLEDPDALLGRAKRIPVLCLDDLGAGREQPTPFAIELLEVLIDRRYQGELTTIVTSNFSTRDLAARLGHSDPMLGERIVTRLVEGAVGYRFTGENVRRRAAA